MSFTKVETQKLNTYKKVSIRPYFDAGKENMGLENYGMSLHDGVYWTEQLACLEKNGIKRYVSGLNEFAPEVKLIKDPEARNAKIKDIRNTVSELEAQFAANIIDPEDPDFWNKVKLLRPDNDEFWSQIELKAGNDITFMDPSTEPYDLIKLYAIDAGGFTIVAPSLRAAQEMAEAPKFYLDRHEETMTTKNTGKKIRNKALSALEDLFNADNTKLLYVAKVIDPGSAAMKKNTSNDDIYNIMDEYITGNSFEKNGKIAAQTFLQLSALNVGELKLKAIVKDAAYYKFIGTKADGFIYHIETATVLGKNPTDVVEYLNNPLNEDMLVAIQEPVEKEWNK